MKFFNRVAPIASIGGSTYIIGSAIKEQIKIAEEYSAHGEIPPIKYTPGGGMYIPRRVNSASSTESIDHGPK